MGVAASCHQADTQPLVAGWGNAVLDVPGLSPDAQLLFRRLLAVSAVPLAELHGVADTAIAELMNAGLAVRLPDVYPADASANEQARLVATTPDEALARLLIGEEKRLNERQERLLDVRHELTGLRSTFEAARAGSPAAGLVEMLVGREAINAAHRAVHNAADRELSVCDTGHYDVSSDTPVVMIPDAGGVVGAARYRTIYDHSIFDIDPVQGARTLSESLAGGEIQRLVPELPLKFVLADESLALVALTITGMDGALLVRSHPLLSLLRMYFEILWDDATPIGGEPEGEGVNERYGAILRLLASGLSDEAIAHQTCLGVRTVRRRIAALMAELGAVTRFQAGALAERAGLLPTRIDLVGPSELARTPLVIAT